MCERRAVAASDELMVTDTDERIAAKRRLILRDSLAFLSLSLVTLVLFGVTLLLFRSFSAHRDELAKRWSERGRQAMQAGHPEQAVVALRTALDYAPDTWEYQLLLAQALGQAGQTDESYSYFMGLHEQRPGEGPIDLQLARLAAKRGDRSAAAEFYRAAIYGTWEGDGVMRRAQTRLELAHYLVATGQLAPARMELLIAAGNMPESSEMDRTLGDMLQQAEDPADAWGFYQKALAATPRDVGLLESAGELAYRTSDYENAKRLLTRAETLRVEEHLQEQPAMETMRANAARMVELMPAATLSMRERGNRVVVALRMARKRMDACRAQWAGAGKQVPAGLDALSERWQGPEGSVDAAALRTDDARQDASMRLVFDTERAAEDACPGATGDDALLLLLARRVNVPAGPERFVGAGR